MCYMALSSLTKVIRKYWDFSTQFKALFNIKKLFFEIMTMATLKIRVRYSLLIDITEAHFTYILSQTFKEINIYGLF